MQPVPPRDGQTTPFCLEVDGVPLPPTNYVHLDAQGRVWITVSTRTTPRSDAYRSDIADGFDDLRTTYLGCLLDESIYQFESPYAGHPPTH